LFRDTGGWGRRLLIIAAPAVAAAVLIAPASSPGQSDRDRLFTTAPLTDYYDSDATWSPDGRFIAFKRHSDQNELWVVNADGTQERRLSPDDTDESPPVWSPDSTRIAYGTFDMGIHVVARDGTGDTRLTRKFGLPQAWSRNGRRILFVRNSVFTVDVRTRREVRIRRPPKFFADVGFWAARWSGDGRWLAMVAESDECACGDEHNLLGVTTAAGKRWKTVDYSSIELAHLSFAWAPRGAPRLAIGRRGRLFLARPRAKRRRVPSGPLPVSAIAWSPGGTKLLWVTRRALYTAAADGRARRAVITLESLDQLRGNRAVQPDPEDLEFADVSWVGQKIAFDLRFPCTRRGIHVVDVQTGTIVRLTNHC